MTDQSTTHPVGADHGTDSTDSSMKDKAAESAQAGKQAVGEVAQTATEQAKGVAQEAQAQARNVLGEARDQLQSHAGDQHRNAVTNLRALGDELRSMADHNGDEGVATTVVSEAAERAHGAAEWLDQRQPGDLVQELRNFARQRPGAFLAGALVAGVVAGRLTRGAVDAHTSDGEPSTAAALPASPATTDTHDLSANHDAPAFQPPAGEYGTVHGSDPDYGTGFGAAGGTVPYDQPGATGFAEPGAGYPASTTQPDQEPWR
jgi:uncharacterized protein YjbJ (UPF0337 family)